MYLSWFCLYRNVYKEWAECMAVCCWFGVAWRSMLDNKLLYCFWWFLLEIGLMGSFHNSVVSSLPPDKTNFPSKYSLHSYSSKNTMHPASQIFLLILRINALILGLCVPLQFCQGAMVCQNCTCGIIWCSFHWVTWCWWGCLKFSYFYRCTFYQEMPCCPRIWYSMFHFSGYIFCVENNFYIWYHTSGGRVGYHHCDVTIVVTLWI